MNCKDLQDLLVAYANGELNGTQKEFIEEHLNGCRECREALYDYAMTREWLIRLRETPGLPEVKDDPISEVRNLKLRSGFKRWFRMAIVAVPLLVITVFATLLATDAFDSASGVIAKAYATGSTLQSYHYVKDKFKQNTPDTEPVHSYHAEADYTAPDSYYVSSESLNGDPSLTPVPIETIRIGDQAYTNSLLVIRYESEWFEQMNPEDDKFLSLLNLLKTTETLDGELIDGVECYHYFGEVDNEKYIAWNRFSLERTYYRMDKSLANGMAISLDTYIEQNNQKYLDQDMTFEFWIGKDDFLLRQAQLVYQTRDGENSSWNEYKTTSILRYSNFNGDISIEAPLAQDGQLQKGWKTYMIEALELPKNE